MIDAHRKIKSFGRTALALGLCTTYASVAVGEPTPSTEPESTITIQEVPAAAVKQVPVDAEELPPAVKNLEQHDVEIVGKFETPGGLQGYAGITQQQPLAIYLTPDGKHVIIGTMMDEEGTDVTQSALTEATIAPWTVSTWDALSKSHWVSDGSDDAEHTIYMFTDPNCPFCHKFWEQARPWIESEKVQIRHILVGVLTQSSPGKAAAILQSNDSAQALYDHENAGPDDGIAPLDSIPAEIASNLERNVLLMKQLQVQGTPGIFYFDQDGALQIQRGAPLDEDLEQILGPR